ncbi:unnamed protein product, partial [Parascedosporium putredinis]
PKSIVDDILTVSKLDSNLLVITPVPSQPVEIIRRAVKMFDPELQAKGIVMIREVHPSLEQMRIDWVMLDPSRVLQILINLITNAIKFTAGVPKRAITVAVSYIPTKATNQAASLTLNDDWGDGEIVYIRFQ